MKISPVLCVLLFVGYGQCTFAIAEDISVNTIANDSRFTIEVVEQFEVKDRKAWEAESIWAYGDHTWGATANAGNLTRFSKNNIDFVEGDGEDGWIMRISIKKEKMLGGYSKNLAREVGLKNYSSGELRSKCDNFGYGYYEVRMRTPQTEYTGFVQSMFTYYYGKATNAHEEIDIELQGQYKDSIMTNFFWGRWPDESPENVAVSEGFNVRDWHTYSFLWLPDKIVWYIDGIEVRQTVSNKARGSDNTIIDELSLIPSHLASLRLNFWITSYKEAFGGDNAGNHYPMVAEYDWFKYHRYLNAQAAPHDNDCFAEDQPLSQRQAPVAVQIQPEAGHFEAICNYTLLNGSAEEKAKLIDSLAGKTCAEAVQ